MFYNLNQPQPSFDVMDVDDSPCLRRRRVRHRIASLAVTKKRRSTEQNLRARIAGCRSPVERHTRHVNVVKVAPASQRHKRVLNSIEARRTQLYQFIRRRFQLWLLFREQPQGDDDVPEVFEKGPRETSLPQDELDPFEGLTTMCRRWRLSEDVQLDELYDRLEKWSPRDQDEPIPDETQVSSSSPRSSPPPQTNYHKSEATPSQSFPASFAWSSSTASDASATSSSSTDSSSDESFTTIDSDHTLVDEDAFSPFSSTSVPSFAAFSGHKLGSSTPTAEEIAVAKVLAGLAHSAPMQPV
ncbi:hypothetical protein PsYK624_103490 [Phanerochaete sordida]|uniref:Uncharacterized protein n=1 Tax=Phanerochaete sordida TaxID=48140 RepID=A0A9P3LG41_9APHY|nr:hypothetical protein PsYK624_103490 [Phanerochaete sordida]